VAATLGTKVRLLGFVPLTDNMTGGDATRVGDVLTIRNGKTVEVLNTDAEGRLILADGLSLASEAGPDAIVDLATLTGACMVALGERTAGLMGNHRGWIDQVRGAADRAGEPVWPLPLPAHLRPKIDSEIADLRNISTGRYGGTLTAGLFLREFVGEGIPWAHVDIAGPSDSSEVDGEIVKGGTGFGIRTLVALLGSFTKPKKADA
jgi:leucyl aminopeptidase